MIVIMGITVIPTLYAWFNIAASWDPYGNTGNLKVAVASNDEGYKGELLPVNLNLGDDVISELQGNKQLNWVFTDAKDAKKGVQSGKYYAAIVIPEDFSKDMMSLFTSDVVHPDITYYINEKENAIAPKVTQKGASSVQHQVNETFITTVSKTTLEALQFVNDVSAKTGDESLTEHLAASLAQISDDLGNISGTVKAFSDMTDAGALMLDTTTSFLEQSGKGTKSSVNALNQAENGIDSLTAIANAHPDQTALVQAINGLNVQIQQAIDQQTQIKNKLDEIAAALPSATADASTLKKELDDLLARGTASVNSVKTSYEQNVKSSLDGLATNLDSTSSSLVSLLGQVDNSVKQIRSVTGSASTDLSTVKEALEQTVSLLNESSEKLQKVSTTLSTDGSDGVQMLEKILAEDPQTIGAFLAAPVSLNETKIYPIENYGTAMAPFYSTLAIWVGAVVMAAMLKVNVSESVVKKLSGAKPHQLYFGRQLLFVCIGLLQSGLICLGDLYFLGIQCEHPFLFLVTGWFTSFVYVNLIYALTVSFGDIGKAVAVVLMVMQVAGSGGTFPIQCAPKFFQAVYPLLPFTHSMNAMRECVAGFYGMNYVKELGYLGIFLIFSLLLGLLLRKPVIKLNDAFTEKLESTHLI